ncbi:transposase, partial [Streptomyces sp. NRAIS3]
MPRAPTPKRGLRSGRLPHRLRPPAGRTEQQTPEWKTRYSVRSGVEGTVNEFAHGHGMRRCRYRGQRKAHMQHVLTAIAPTSSASAHCCRPKKHPSRRPTAFQNYLDQREISRPKSWRTLGTSEIPDRVKFRLWHRSWGPVAEGDSVV